MAVAAIYKRHLDRYTNEQGIEGYGTITMGLSQNVEGPVSMLYNYYKLEAINCSSTHLICDLMLTLLLTFSKMVIVTTIQF